MRMTVLAVLAAAPLAAAAQPMMPSGSEPQPLRKSRKTRSLPS